MLKSVKGIFLVIRSFGVLKSPPKFSRGLEFILAKKKVKFIFLEEKCDF